MKSNILKLMAWAAVVCGVSMFAACNDETEPETPEENYIILDNFAHTFLHNEDSPLTVNVNSTSTWSTEISYEAAKSYYEVADNDASGGDWLEIDAYNDSSITFSVVKNEGQHLRRASITFTNEQGKQCVLNVSQTAKPVSGPSFYINEANIPVVMSQKGKYASYVVVYWETVNENTIFYYDPVIVNLETGKEEVLERLTGVGTTRCTAISDNGILVLSADGSTSSIIYKDGEYRFIDLPAEANYISSSVQNISSDGTVMVGYVSLGGAKSIPVKWVNGELVLLDKPEIDIDGISPCNLVYARGISADNSIIHGTTWNYPNFMAVYWTEDNKVHYVAEETIEVTESEPWYDYWGGEHINIHVSGPTLDSNRYIMSPNAKYIGYKYQTMTSVDADIFMDYQTTFYDMENNNVLARIEEESGPLTITNNGLAFYGTPGMAMSKGYVYDLNTHQVQTAEQWVLETYGIMIPDNCVITHVGEDMKSVLGFRQVASLATSTIFCYWYINAY